MIGQRGIYTDIAMALAEAGDPGGLYGDSCGLSDKGGGSEV